MTESKEANGEVWDLEIKPKAGILELNLKHVWRYRDLILLFVRRDFVAQYKQTVLGPIWFVVQPILTTIMFMLIFTRVARIPTDGISPIVFYMSGITIWTFFSTCLISTSHTFTSNANIFGKVYFPRLVTPISIVIANFIRFCIQFCLLLITMVWFSFKGFPVNITVYWLLVPALLVLFASMALGIGIIVSSLTTKYRDFGVLVNFSMQLLMYATPIVYPISFLETKGVAWAIQLNPLSALVEAFRFCLLGKGTFTMEGLLFSFSFAIVILFLGLVLFNRVEKTFMDTV
jgi:lipopolysaccharide transport system permease protein